MLKICLGLGILIAVYKVLSLNGELILKSANSMFPDGPVIYPTNVPWCEMLRANCEMVKTEYDEYCQSISNKLLSFSDIDSRQALISIDPQKWKVVMLKLYNKNTENVQFFPKTLELMKNIPDCSLIMFSILESGQKIIPHKGYNKGIYRYHLTLHSPTDNENCWIRIANENNEIYQHNWESGKDFAFDDTWLHWVQNDTTERRVVLFLDIKRKFSNPILNWINDIILFWAPYDEKVKSMVNNVNK